MIESNGVVSISRKGRNDTNGARSVLLVDATENYGLHLQNVLAAHRSGTFFIEQAGDLDAARIALSRPAAIDVILLDVNLHGNDRHRLVDEAFAAAAGIPIVLLSDSVHESAAWQVAPAGAQGVMIRDRMTPEALAWALQHAVEQHLLRASLMRHVHELELSNGRFLSLAVDNADAIVVVDGGGTVRFVNPAAENLLKCPAEDLLGQTFGVPLEGVTTSEIDVRDRAGGSKTAELRVTGTQWDAEPAFIVTMRDVTQRKRNEMALRLAKQTAEQASALKSQFLANMSHELRTPLNAIIGYSEMMMMGIAGAVSPAPYGGYIADIHSGGKHLLSLINDLLDLSKLESGKLELMEENFDLVALMTQTVDLLAGQAGAKGVDLSFVRETRSAWIRADERMIKQALMNLLGNAIKFTDTGGKVSASVNRSYEGDTRIVVGDTGIGIPDDQIPRAFAAFVQIESAYTRAENTGTGLGLSLCKRYVEMHQGRIQLESKVGVGTTATLTIPKARTVSCEPDGDVVSIADRFPRDGRLAKGQ